MTVLVQSELKLVQQPVQICGHHIKQQAYHLTAWIEESLVVNEIRLIAWRVRHGMSRVSWKEKTVCSGGERVVARSEPKARSVRPYRMRASIGMQPAICNQGQNSTH